jgi:hypothetical protein
VAYGTRIVGSFELQPTLCTLPLPEEREGLRQLRSADAVDDEVHGNVDSVEVGDNLFRAEGGQVAASRARRHHIWRLRYRVDRVRRSQRSGGCCR